MTTAMWIGLAILTILGIGAVLLLWAACRYGDIIDKEIDHD